MRKISLLNYIYQQIIQYLNQMMNVRIDVIYLTVIQDLSSLTKYQFPKMGPLLAPKNIENTPSFTIASANFPSKIFFISCVKYIKWTRILDCVVDEYDDSLSSFPTGSRYPTKNVRQKDCQNLECILICVLFCRHSNKQYLRFAVLLQGIRM